MNEQNIQNPIEKLINMFEIPEEIPGDDKLRFNNLVEQKKVELLEEKKTIVCNLKTSYKDKNNVSTSKLILDANKVSFKKIRDITETSKKEIDITEEVLDVITEGNYSLLKNEITPGDFKIISFIATFFLMY